MAEHTELLHTIEVEPPRRLSHTWRLLTRDDPWTLVTWELSEADGSTRVTVRHSEWPADTRKLRGVDSTWKQILRELKRLLETGGISPQLKAQYTVMRAFMWALPARTQTGNAMKGAHRTPSVPRAPFMALQHASWAPWASPVSPASAWEA